MEINTVIMAVAIHLCPFVSDGKQYQVIPLSEILAIATQTPKQTIWPPNQMGVIVTSIGCDASDGTKVPGVLPSMKD